MYSTILAIHIIAASIVIASGSFLLVKAFRQIIAPKVLGTLYASFGSTIVSGTLLIILSPSAVMHFCVIMSVFSLGVIAAQRIYVSRTAVTR